MLTRTNKLQQSFAVASVLLLALTACSKSNLGSSSVEVTSIDGELYLTYGVPIPEGQELVALPQPYDPETMGPPAPDLTKALNLAELPGYRDIPNPMDTEQMERLSKQDNPALSTLAIGPTSTSDDHTNRGFYLLKTTDHPFARVQAHHDVQNNTVVPNPISSANEVLFYAPTLMPAGGSCIESTTIHRRRTVDGPTQHLHGFYDWCSSTGGFKNTKDLTNSTFQSHYIRVYNGEQFLFTYVHQNAKDGCWGAGFYDFTLGKYDQQFYLCGQMRLGRNDGWTMYETYNVMRNNSGPKCPSNPNIKAADIKVGTAYEPSSIPFDRYGNTYQALDNNNSCIYSGKYSFVKPAPGGFASNSWQMNTH